MQLRFIHHLLGSCYLREKQLAALNNSPCEHAYPLPLFITGFSSQTLGTTVATCATSCDALAIITMSRSSGPITMSNPPPIVTPKQQLHLTRYWPENEALGFEFSGDSRRTYRCRWIIPSPSSDCSMYLSCSIPSSLLIWVAMIQLRTRRHPPRHRAWPNQLWWHRIRRHRC